MRVSTSVFREAFSVIPEKARKAVIGKRWEPKPTTGSRRTPGEIRSCLCCPLGIVGQALGMETYTPASDVFVRDLNVHYRISVSANTVGDFILAWDDGTMSVEEMEEIFA